MLIVRGSPAGEEVGPEQGVVVDEGVLPRPDAAGEAAAAVLPRPDEGRQHGERAVEHRPVLVVLGADQRADGGRADRAPVAGEALDGRRVDAADRRGPRRRPVGDVLDELGEADGVVVDVGLVDEAVAHEHVDHRQHQRDVGAGQRLHELVGGLGGDRADRVDDDDLGAVGPGRLDGRPQVAVREPGVRAPDEDQLRRGAARADRDRGRCRSSCACRGRPSGRRSPARSRLAPSTLKKRSLRPIIASRLWLPASLNGRTVSPPWRVDGVVQAGGDLGQRVVPRDLLERARALRAGAPQRVQEAVGAVDAVEEAVDLRAQLAGAVGVVDAAAQLDGDPVVDGHRPAARVRAVVVARPVDRRAGMGQARWRPIQLIRRSHGSA